jgi:peptide/nickel transport system permease protein
MQRELSVAMARPVSDERTPSLTQLAIRRLLRNRPGMLALIGLVVIAASVSFAHLLTPYNPVGVSFANRYKPPFWSEGGSISNMFGTDAQGRDLLARILYGGRVSLLVGFVSSSIAGVVGIALGLISGYFGGFVDKLITRITQVWLAFPFLVLAIAVVAVVGSSVQILVILLSLAAWVYPCRITRAETMRVKNIEFVRASVGFGARAPHILLQHILPNVITPNIVIWTFSVATLILVESGLSFLGLGVRPPTPSWGNILNDGRQFITTGEWWLTIIPGMAITLTVLCVNTLGDALQRAFDVRVQQN